MTEQGAGQAAAAGWYPDPSNPAGLRFWDGAQWTSQTARTRDSAFPPPSGAPAGGPPPVLSAPRKGLPGWAIGLIVGGSVLILGGIAAAAAIPVALSQRAKAEDTEARADVATLGYDIVTWYVDNTESPVVTQPGGAGTPYFLNGDQIAYAAQNVHLGGMTATSSTDWCVSVNYPEGDLRNWEFSAAHGLEQGSC